MATDTDCAIVILKGVGRTVTIVVVFGAGALYTAVTVLFAPMVAVHVAPLVELQPAHDEK
jgi:hypothetical protein